MSFRSIDLNKKLQEQFDVIITNQLKLCSHFVYAYILFSSVKNDYVDIALFPHNSPLVESYNTQHQILSQGSII